MTGIVSALRSALRHLFVARVLLLVGLPFAAALAIWGVAAWVFWDDWQRALGDWLRIDAIAGHLERFGLEWLASTSLAVLYLALLIPATVFTALFAIAVFAMPVLIEVVAQREFPELERRQGGGNVGSVLNALSSLLIYATLWVLSLPLWLVPPLGVLLPLLLTGWLNQRLFRYDALAEHADPYERERVILRAKGRLYVLGVLLALFQFIPVVNLVAPIFAALVFVRFCLAELAALRAGRQPAPAAESRPLPVQR